MISQKLKSHITDIPDFPKPGIIFKDITPVLQNADLCKEIIEHIENQLSSVKIDAIAGIESRGFLFGMMLAQKLGVPFIPVRKAGKLPGKTQAISYDLEYGSATIEIQEHAIQKDWNIVIHDDLLATGGTAIAAAQLIQNMGANVSAFSFLINLSFLNTPHMFDKYSTNIYTIAEY